MWMAPNVMYVARFALPLGPYESNGDPKCILFTLNT